jgi:surface polysaccharide O-acyltransferase-like enzyme
MQLYFLYVIAGLYALTPPLRRLLRHCDQRQWALVAGGALLFAVLDASLHDLAHAGATNAVTRCLEFAGYYVAGGLLVRARLPRWSVPAGLVAFVASVGLTVGISGALAAHYGWELPAYYLFSYQSPTVVVMSLAVFVVGRAVGERLALRPVGWFAAVARATFGVFLVHPVLLLPYLRDEGLPGSPGSLLLTVPAIVLGVCAVSTVITLAMERIPLARRLV